MWRWTVWVGAGMVGRGGVRRGGEGVRRAGLAPSPGRRSGLGRCLQRLPSLPPLPASTVLPWAAAPVALSGWGPPGQKQTNGWRGHRRGFREEAEAREGLRLEMGGARPPQRQGWAEESGQNRRRRDRG